MKVLRMFGAVIGTIAIVGMFSCGGSSYLTEFPTEGENMSSATVTAGGLTDRSSMRISLGKDILLDPVDGATGGSGDSFLDAGLHECFFEVEPATKPDGDILIKSSAAECVGITDCGYCAATQTGYPNCELNCMISTSASDNLIGEYLEFRYVDKAILYSDAGGSSGGALRGEGEALFNAVGSHNFDSTTRSFSIIDGGLTLDQVTPLTDVNNVDKFDYTMEITDMILDPSASSHNAAIPDNTAWVDIESRITAQIPLDALALPNSTVSMDAGIYASNWGFWHDLANEQDIMAFVQMFDQMLEFTEADILSYINCSTAWEQIDTDVQCLPIDTNRTAAGVPELLITSVGASSAVMAHSDITDQAACAAIGGEIGSDVDPALPGFCLPATLTQSLDEYPITGGGGGPLYSMADVYTVSDDGVGADKTTADYLTAIYDNGVTEDNMIDEAQQCAAFGNMRASILDVQFFGNINLSSPDCIEVADRFIQDPLVAANLRALEGNFSVEFETVDSNEYMKLYFYDQAENPDHPQAGRPAGDPLSRYYGEHQIFWNLALGIDRTWLGAPSVFTGVAVVGATPMLYAHDGVTFVNANMQIGWIDQAIDKTGIGDEKNNDFLIQIVFINDSSANDCDDGGGDFGFSGIVIGSNTGTSSACANIDQYGRDDAYMTGIDVGGGLNDTGLVVEEPPVAAMSTIFTYSTEAQSLGAADWTASDKTLRDMWTECNSKTSHLWAKPYYNNAIYLETDDSIDDVCREVAQRFVSTTINVGDEGTDKLLTPYSLQIDFTDPEIIDQGMAIRILDGSDTLVFQDVTGSYLPLNANWIPAKGYTYDSLLQWFTADSQRVSCGTNQINGHPMSIYTPDGSEKDGYPKVSTYLDFHRVRKIEQHDAAPQDVYLLTLDLNEPVDAEGTLAVKRCGFGQTFVIDGSCTCEIDSSCP